MALPYCLCDRINPLTSDVGGCLLQHENESKKFSNTGKLVRHLLPHFQQKTWHRKQPIDWNVDSGGRTPVLVFPSDDAQSLLLPSTSQYWIVVDATWQQARKMVRQSPVLAALPRVSIAQPTASQYRLRRNQTDQGLCTLEVIAALLADVGESSNALALRTHLEGFMDAYEAQRQDTRISNV